MILLNTFLKFFPNRYSSRFKQRNTLSLVCFVELSTFTIAFALFAPFAKDSDTVAKPTAKDNPVTKNDFYFDGLSGADGSREKRKLLAKALNLPEDMTANALLEAVNLLIDKDEYKRLLSSVK